MTLIVVKHRSSGRTTTYGDGGVGTLRNYVRRLNHTLIVKGDGTKVIFDHSRFEVTINESQLTLDVDNDY